MGSAFNLGAAGACYKFSGGPRHTAAAYGEQCLLAAWQTTMLAAYFSFHLAGS
jgi:hypothetical protein